ncbi:hypothetical protein GBAR_LOCUS15408, partial [Geodia barretti]
MLHFHHGMLHCRRSLSSQSDREKMIRGSPCDSFSTDGHHSKCTEKMMMTLCLINMQNNTVYLVSIGV